MHNLMLIAWRLYNPECHSWELQMAKYFTTSLKGQCSTLRMSVHSMNLAIGSQVQFLLKIVIPSLIVS